MKRANNTKKPYIVARQIPAKYAYKVAWLPPRMLMGSVPYILLPNNYLFYFALSSSKPMIILG